MTEPAFIIEKPRFDPVTGELALTYRLGVLDFHETLTFPLEDMRQGAAETAAFERMADLTAAVLGVSYYKLRAPLSIDASALALDDADRAFLIDVYENGLGEFFARNNLKRFGKLSITTHARAQAPSRPQLAQRALVLIGGGKDSLVSLGLLERSGTPITLFAVNPKGPILTSAKRSGHDLIGVSRRLDPEMIRLGSEPDYYNGHVPSTAINSMIASLACLLYGFDAIVLSNERSASEGNIDFDGRQANHQYSKSIEFERRIGERLTALSGDALSYFSLLRPFSEVRIAQLFARDTRFDDVFSSCNRNFLQAGHDGPLWCGKCPKCLFVFLIFAPFMARDRLVGIFGQNILDRPDTIALYEELTGLDGHKPWECVGEILEAAACLWHIASLSRWADAEVVAALAPRLEAFYSRARLEGAYRQLLEDSQEHLLPDTFRQVILSHAH